MSRTSVNSQRAALRRRPSPDGVGVRSRAAGGDRLGGRSLPARRAVPAPARRRLAGGPDGDVRGRRDGRLLRRHVVRAGGLRHHAAERAHGPAHGARRCWSRWPWRSVRRSRSRCARSRTRPRRWLLVVLHSRVAKVLTFPPLTLALYVVSPWALYFSGWYAGHPGPRLAARADAPAPGRGRHRCSSGRSSASTRCRGGSATRPGCCWWCSRCRSTRSWASRSWARRRCSAATTTGLCASCPATAGSRTRSTTSTWPAACSGRPGTWSGWCCSGCSSPSGSGPP